MNGNILHRRRYELIINKEEAISSSKCVTNFIVDKLIEYDAPIILMRNNKLDLSRYNIDEIKILSEITEEILENGDRKFIWFKEV